MTRARLLGWRGPSGALAACCAFALLVPGGSALAQGERDRAALVVVVPGVSFEELLAIPDVAALARAGGGGLLANAQDVVTSDGPAGSPEVTVVLDPAPPSDPDRVGAQLRAAVGSSAAPELMVIVLGTEAADPADELAGIALATGAPGDLFPDDGERGALTSDSTSRVGVVTGGDVRATLDGYLGGALLVAGDLPYGEPIRVVPGPPPFELHERYLAQRRMYVPIGAAAALYAAAAGLAAGACVAFGRRVTAGWGRVAGWAALAVPMLATGMLAAGHLPELTYATAVPMIAIVAVFGTLAFSPLERADPTLVPAGIGAAVLALFALEAVLGWSGMLTPLLGGTQLDGGRFYGLPNVGIGLLVGSGLWVAQRLGTARGFALLCALGLFAGLPLLGANLGGAVTVFAAAGLWLGVRERERLGTGRALVAAAAVTVAGAAVVLLAHAIAPVATHVTRFEESAEGVGGVLDRFGERLEVGFDLIARSPAALIPVLGLPVALLVVLRPPAPIRETFERRPAWRDATLVTLVAGIVAYVVNDSGPAAAGLAFGLGLGGMLGVSLLAPPEKMGRP
ncbi:MAG: hypothetical protein ACXWX6_00345 [Actinomycetota bacterium]